jgi:hypothetical protein
MRGIVHLEDSPLVICDIALAYVIMQGMIQKLVGFLKSSNLHWEVGIIRSATKDMAGPLVEVEILIDRGQPVICFIPIVWEEVSCIKLFRFIFGGGTSKTFHCFPERIQI